MQERLVPIRKGNESVEILEGGSGRDLMFFAGAGGLNWDPFLEALAHDHHVVAPRLPGTGQTTGDDGILDIHDLIYYLLDFLDEMGIEDADLVGHSLGGMIAAELAAVQPRRFRRVVLIAPAGLWNDAYPNEDFFVYRQMPQEMAVRAFHDPGALPQPPAPTDPEAIKAMMVTQARNMTVAAKYLWPVPDKGLKKRAHRISAPTLILWGKSDRIVAPQYANDFARLIPNATVKLFDRSGHMPQIEQRDETVAAIREFLGS
jgi:pimeloyl-ACP methyl ester carboxylesterase